MTDETPTPEQRAAWNNLQEELRREDLPVIGFSLAVLTPLLPKSLTSPPVDLPKEPGLYVDKDGEIWRRRGGALNDWCYLDVHGPLIGGGRALTPEQYAPFTPLVPERPLVTREQIHHIVGTGTLLSSEINQLLAIANGTPDE